MKTAYNSVERAVAKALANFPFVKKIAKSLYSRFVYLHRKKNYSHKTSIPINKVVADRTSENFFGYYDKSPISKLGFVLTHLTDYKTTFLPSRTRGIVLAVYSLEDGNSVFKIPVCAYNWQQGARAHWLNDDLFIFNDFDESAQKYVSRVFSLSKKKEIKTFFSPVQDSFGINYFLSINYSRLMAMRPDYGYRNLPSLTEVELANITDDGIWRIEYASGSSSLLVSLDQVLQSGYDPAFNKSIHKINHVMISPGGEKFIFLHRYYLGNRRFDRLLVAQSDGTNIKTLVSFGMISHCCWVDDNTVLGYLRGPSGQDGYWLIDINTGEIKRFADGKLDTYGDGHPHVCGDWFVTDTYPDKARMQHLLLCNLKTGKIKQLGEFFHGFNFHGETRCDLHPRFSLDGEEVFFDSVFSGKRQLYSMSIKK